MGTCASVLSVLDHPTIEFQEKTVEEKRLAILEKIRSEPIIVELKILFYIAACDSKIDQSTVVPSPKDYLNKEPIKEVIQEVNESIPNIQLLQLYLENPSLNQISEDLLTLLYWLLIGLKEPRLLLLENENDWPDIDLHCYESGDGVKKPDKVIKVCYSTMSMRYMSWKAKSYGKKTLLGFTNVSLPDVHAAIHCGTRQLISRIGIGYGLAIASNISSCFKRKEFSWTWGKSTIGTQMSVMMIMEFAEDPKSMMKLSHYKPLYYLISDPSYARIRYLLIWIHSKPVNRPHALTNLMVKYSTTPIISSIVLIAALLLPKKTPFILQKLLLSIGRIAKGHK